ncbi:MAG: hypothetical protein ACTHLE_04335 [Agriterribacter sp.]
MEQITTFEQACEKKGLDPTKVLPDVSAYPEQHQKAIIATAKLFVINEVLNQDENGQPWKPDWSSYEEDKYYPWFDLETYEKGSSPGFRFDDTYYEDASTNVGSRLCYRTHALAKYAGETFIDLYRNLMVL